MRLVPVKLLILIKIKGLIIFLQYRNEGSGKDYEHDETEGFAQDYMRYYQETYDDAMMGDESAVMEMQDEFGDDWKGEF